MSASLFFLKLFCLRLWHTQCPLQVQYSFDFLFFAGLTLCYLWGLNSQNSFEMICSVPLSPAARSFAFRALTQFEISCVAVRTWSVWLSTELPVPCTVLDTGVRNILGNFREHFSVLNNFPHDPTLCLSSEVWDCVSHLSVLSWGLSRSLADVVCC